MSPTDSYFNFNYKDSKQNFNYKSYHECMICHDLPVVKFLIWSGYASKIQNECVAPKLPVKQVHTLIPNLC